MNSIELNLGYRAVFQLQEKFRFLNSQLNCEGFLPVVNIPIDLAKKLYLLYIESVNLQKENQDQILSILNREDEMYAKRLVQEDLKSEFSFLQNSNFNFGLKDHKSELQQNNATNQINPRKEEIIELILDCQVLSQLEEQFGEFSTIPQGFQPVVQISVKLAEELYSAYIESLFLQKENEKQLLATIAKHERKAAKKLRQQENTQNQVEYRLIAAKEKVVTKPARNSSQSTCDNIVNKAPAVNIKKAAENYRLEAQMHLEKQQEFNSKAKQAYQQKKVSVAQHYSDTARTHRDLYYKANEMAVTLLMEDECAKQNDTLDLHYFNVKEAIQSLDIFIDAKIMLLKKSRKRFKILYIITGRGKHSGNKGSKLGPAVQGLLRKRNISFTQPVSNPGMLQIKVYSHTLLVDS